MRYLLELDTHERDRLCHLLAASNDPSDTDLAADISDLRPVTGVVVELDGETVRVATDVGVPLPVTVVRHNSTVEHLVPRSDRKFVTRVAECLALQTAATPVIESLNLNVSRLQDTATGLHASRSDTLATLRDMRATIDALIIELSQHDTPT